MSANKTQPTDVSVQQFLDTVSERRQEEAATLIALMQEISHEPAVMWGPSIIGFGTQHYTYDSGREGDMGLLGFSPRKAAITVYFNEGFDRYADMLKKLGTHTHSVSCLYIKKLSDIDVTVLRAMLQESYELATDPKVKATSVDEYLAHVPSAARTQLDELRAIVTETLPLATEVLSYGIIGYKIDEKRARVYVSGWKDHVAMYPTPKDEALQEALKPYRKGKGTLWFPLDEPLPKQLIAAVTTSLAS